MEPVEPAVERKEAPRRVSKVARTGGKDQKNAQTRGDSTLPRLRKISELVAATTQACLKEQERHASRIERVRCLCNLVFAGGAFSTMLKNSTLLTQDDKSFLKEIGFLNKE